MSSNIAEGMERNSFKEQLRFLSYAKGSCGELRIQVYIGIEIGYIEKSTGMIWVNESKQISSMLMGLHKRVKRKLNIGNEVNRLEAE